MNKTVEFESALTTIAQVIDEHWDNLTADQRKVMRQIESVIDDATDGETLV